MSKWHVFETTIDGLGRMIATCDSQKDAEKIAKALVEVEYAEDIDVDFWHDDVPETYKIVCEIELK